MAGTKHHTKHKTTSDLRGLSPLLQEWIRVVEDFCTSEGFERNPWWYNERASLSTLAGAAWRLGNGWTALEEFATQKRGVVPGKMTDPSKGVRGRCDLYVSHKSTDFAIEAKQAWQSLGVRTRQQKISSAMGSAKRDAGNLTVDEASYRLGAVFTVPYIPTSEVSSVGRNGELQLDPKKVLQRVNEWLKERELGQYDAYAYFFTERCLDFVSEKADRVFPGVLLTINQCKKGTQRPRTK